MAAGGRSIRRRWQCFHRLLCLFSENTCKSFSANKHTTDSVFSVILNFPVFQIPLLIHQAHLLFFGSGFLAVANKQMDQSINAATAWRTSAAMRLEEHIRTLLIHSQRL
jgi:hypothetical protein